MRRPFLITLLGFGALLLLGMPCARAATAYSAFTASAHEYRGLFPIWQKDGGTYLELDHKQLDTDFLETIAPGNGLAQEPLWWGDTDYLPTQVLRFERHGDNIVMIWKNWYAHAGTRESAQAAIAGSFPDSVAGVGREAYVFGGHVVQSMV